MLISKTELLSRIINLEDDIDILSDRIVDLEKKIKKLEKTDVKKTTKKVNKKG